VGAAGIGGDLYHELKHIRNAIESLRASLAVAQRTSEQSRHIEAIAAAHRIPLSPS
jgi:DNA-binding FadR family transcriptional regulator